jgi:phospholipid transport system substrate-binding protein
MRRLLIKSVILGLTLQLVFGVSGAWAASATEVVRSVIERALDVLKNPAYSKSQKHQMVKSIVDPHFDYREMAKLSLASTWYKISAGQQDEFVGLFAHLLEASYADKIDKYAQRVRIDYTGQIPAGADRVEVRTVVVRPNDRIPLNYRLLQEGGTWKVYDVIIEGVSLVSNYRSQFRRIIHQSSYADLVRRLRNKVAEDRQTG